MRRIATSLRNERPPSAAAGTVSTTEDRSWGFLAVDGLPDLEAAPAYSRKQRDHLGRLLLTSGSASYGFDDDVLGELAKVHASARIMATDGNATPRAGAQRSLSVYEIEVCDAMAARRDAAVRLGQLLAEDVAHYEYSLDAVQNGLVLDMLVPAIGGRIRQCLSGVMTEFEGTRHRFRLALVAVALDNDMSAVEIGEALAFSRQLASRYLAEARVKWPELAERRPARRRAG